MRLILPLLMLLLLPLAGLGPAQAQDPPACTSAQEGAVACLAGRLCTCRFTRGGSMTGRPDRHAWDCGILRPACGAGRVPPSMPPAPMPEILLQPNIQPGYGYSPQMGLKPQGGGR
ncbi:hypothetical protein HB662_02050 [Roseomonas frigidaquae]|uniref:Secreted protein n=1 Tax=Falsiroseomonas frigidaquae TaxID=487318 RepID=A0ABX1EU14_9PROT|nr:hypothetical protein [Falsiroseomonas frigidaquae]NKE43542.1 hypothetical protein [Falsiroseomonas frigidaquae]